VNTIPDGILSGLKLCVMALFSYCCFQILILRSRFINHFYCDSFLKGYGRYSQPSLTFWCRTDRAGRPPTTYSQHTRAWPTHLDGRTRRSELTRDPQNMTAGSRSEYLNPVRCLTSQSAVTWTHREAKHSVPPST